MTNQLLRDSISVRHGNKAGINHHWVSYARIQSNVTNHIFVDIGLMIK